MFVVVFVIVFIIFIRFRGDHLLDECQYLLLFCCGLCQTLVKLIVEQSQLNYLSLLIYLDLLFCHFELL
jgi:hypothetical protein